MLCFEVSRNGERLCMAGIADFGVLTALVHWVAHHPDKLARWAAEGIPETEPMSLRLSVAGLSSDEHGPHEHLKWVDTALAVGDEILIRLVDARMADAPEERYRGER